jgi:hypothetical protein
VTRAGSMPDRRSPWNRSSSHEQAQRADRRHSEEFDDRPASMGIPYLTPGGSVALTPVFCSIATHAPYRIPCKYGFISIHGLDTLAGFANTSIMAGKLVAVPGVKVHQRGDREVRVLFAPNMLDAIARLLRARRKRQVSEEERARLKAMSARFGFPARRTG